MTKEKLEIEIIDKAKIIASALIKGKDVEIRKSSTGITVAEVKKNVISR